jgi:hypothetical protein
MNCLGYDWNKAFNFSFVVNVAEIISNFSNKISTRVTLPVPMGKSEIELGYISHRFMIQNHLSKYNVYIYAVLVSLSLIASHAIDGP